MKFNKTIGISIILFLSGVVIACVWRLWSFAPYGSLGYIDGHSLDHDRLFLIMFITFPVIIGVYAIIKELLKK